MLPFRVNLNRDFLFFDNISPRFFEVDLFILYYIQSRAGYSYSYPFLSIESGIHVEDNFIQPLYKHIFNIEHPTMGFIGLAMAAYKLPLFDLQVNFITST